MKPFQWEKLQKAARGESLLSPPVALIVDSPWIPPFLGISTVDYIALPEVWFRSNVAVMERFPEAIFLPGFWVEPGMAAEPSAFGCRVSFSSDQPPSIHPIASEVSQLDSLEPANPRTDGLMPLVLSQYKGVLPRVRNAGMDIKIVAARGPLALAAHLLGLTGFLVGLKTEPEKTHALLSRTTQTVKDWLDAQASVLPGVEGIMVLDDVVGFLSPDDYREFAHPRLKEIFAVPAALKILHNDTDFPACGELVADLGVHVFNFTHRQPLSSVRRRAGSSVCLMGNVAPRDVLAEGTPAEVAAAAAACLRENACHPAFLLSAGGGISPGTPAENIDALVRASLGTGNQEVEDGKAGHSGRG